MRYFFVSDIHGQLDKLLEALAAAGFSVQNDTIVSVGDAFDRGKQNPQVLDFLLGCPHRILLWGNHDRRLKELASGSMAQDYDRQNGTLDTVRQLANHMLMPAEKGQFYACQRVLTRHQKLWQYFRECHFAVEFPDLIATHAWLPTYTLVSDYVLRLDPDWRNCKVSDWDRCIWGQTLPKVMSDAAYPEKKLLIGHWWAWDIAEHCGVERAARPLKKNPDLDCSTFIYKDKLICIDGCSNYEHGGCVNVYVYESDAEPTFIL